MTSLIRSIVWTAALLVACGGGPASGVDAPAPDGGTTDASANAGVACGLAPTLTCDLPGQACCDLPSPSTDLCYAVQGGICEGGTAMRCDGPEDCMAGEVCCLFGGGSTCTESPTCAPGGGRIMCHEGAVTGCAGADVCCRLGPGPTTSPYAACFAIACPP